MKGESVHAGADEFVLLHLIQRRTIGRRELRWVLPAPAYRLKRTGRRQQRALQRSEQRNRFVHEEKSWRYLRLLNCLLQQVWHRLVEITDCRMKIGPCTQVWTLALSVLERAAASGESTILVDLCIGQIRTNADRELVPIDLGFNRLQHRIQEIAAPRGEQITACPA